MPPTWLLGGFKLLREAPARVLGTIHPPCAHLISGYGLHADFDVNSVQNNEVSAVFGEPWHGIPAALFVHFAADLHLLGLGDE